MKLFLPVIFALWVIVLPVYGAELIIESGQNSLSNPAEELQVSALLKISQSSGTRYYLRGVFFQKDTSNYCGFTWNGNSWFSGPYSADNGWKNFFPVEISEGSWSGILKARIDTADSGCRNSGTYGFKIQRFTENSASGVFDTQQELTLQITIPTPTPSPAPSATPTHLPTNTPTPKSDPAATVKPSPTILSKTIITPSVRPTDKMSPDLSADPTAAEISRSGSESASVLGETAGFINTDGSGSESSGSSRGYRPLIISLSLISAGAAILAAVAAWKKFQEIAAKKTADIVQ